MMKRSRRVVMTQPMKPATIAKSRPNGSTESQSAPVSCSESAMVAVVGVDLRSGIMATTMVVIIQVVEFCC